MQFDIPLYSSKSNDSSRWVKVPFLSWDTAGRKGTVTHNLSFGCPENFWGSWFSHIYVFLISCNTNQKGIAVSVCVCLTDRERGERSERRNRESWWWGHLRLNWKEKFTLLSWFFIFLYTWTMRKKSIVVLNISYFYEITISSQIRHLTDDRLLPKQYVPEPVFLPG